MDNTADKIRYSTLELQRLNAGLRALQEEHDLVQKALSEDLCRKVIVLFHELVNLRYGISPFISYEAKNHRWTVLGTITTER